MKTPVPLACCAVGAFAAFLLAAPFLIPLAAAEESAWPEVARESKPWTRWWWPGSGVDEANLTAQLEAFAAAGLGGVEITPIYGARGYEARYVDFLSPRWVELLRHTGEEARRLGMGVDMATGTGWPFGGPWVTEAEAAKKLVWSDGRLGLEPTGQEVKRAAPGGEGLVLDPFSPAALRSYLKRFEDAFSELPTELLRSQFHDSFEYYGANGTEALAERFRSMHGYELLDWADALLGERQEDPDTIARLKADFRHTLDQLHQDYLQEWKRWSNERGWLIRNQSHGAPANLLDLYAIADIPETEIFGSTPFPIPGLRRDDKAIRHNLDLPEPLVSRMASSAAHVMGKPLVSCETATWLRDHWKVALSHVKPELDRIFLDGINHVFYHGAVYSPAEAPWPGWLFYASTQFNPQNTWWQDFAALNQYVARSQSILQNGEPDNDVLLYWPAHDVWHDPKGLAKQLTVHHVGFVTEAPFGDVAKSLMQSGYGVDYISDAQIAQARGEPGRVLTPGNHYATLVVPPTRHMPLETLSALLRIAEQGGTVIFAELPTDVPGLGRLEERRSEFQSMLEALAGADLLSESLRSVETGRGLILLGDPKTALAEVANARPEPMLRQGVDCIRRRHENGWDYFIANLGDQTIEGWFELGVPARDALLLDPLNGRSGSAAIRSNQSGASEVYLQLDPGQSFALRASREKAAERSAWTYFARSDRTHDLSGPWNLTFISGGPELPEDQQIDSLGSWTESGDPETERFAGTARYTIDFDLPETEVDDWQIDLGELRESARVTVNGQFVETLWSLPFRLRIGQWLKPGRNTLSIEVTNTAANRIRDMDRRGVDWKIMREINFVDINYRRFDASNWEIESSGLIGPVTLHALHAVDPR